MQNYEKTREQKNFGAIIESGFMSESYLNRIRFVSEIDHNDGRDKSNPND